LGHPPFKRLAIPASSRAAGPGQIQLSLGRWRSPTLCAGESPARKCRPLRELVEAQPALQPFGRGGIVELENKQRQPDRPGTPRPPGREHNHELHSRSEPQPRRRAKPHGPSPGRGGLMRTPGRLRRYYIFMQTSICRWITLLSAAYQRASGAFQAGYVIPTLAAIKNITDGRCSD